MPRAQILEEEIPPGVAAQVLAWVPGYNAMRTTARHLKGYQVEPLETAEALFDAVTTVMLVGKLVNQGVKVVGKAGGAAVRAVEEQAIKELAGRAPGQAARTLAARLPGSLTFLMRTLPGQVGRIDITRLARLAAVGGKKVGVRTWGRLDRRIIQRGDRRVIFNPLDREVVKEIGDEARVAVKDAIRESIEESWDDVARRPGEFGPCIMEQVDSRLAILPGVWPARRPSVVAPLIPVPATLGGVRVTASGIDWRAPGIAAGAALLVLGGVAFRAGRRHQRLRPPADRPRPYRE